MVTGVHYCRLAVTAVFEIVLVVQTMHELDCEACSQDSQVGLYVYDHVSGIKHRGYLYRIPVAWMSCTGQGVE